jgi:hypothetical protein
VLQTKQWRKPDQSSNKLLHATIPLRRVPVLSGVPHNIDLSEGMRSTRTDSRTSMEFYSGPSWMRCRLTRYSWHREQGNCITLSSFHPSSSFLLFTTPSSSSKPSITGNKKMTLLEFPITSRSLMSSELFPSQRASIFVCLLFVYLTLSTVTQTKASIVSTSSITY